MKKLLPILLLVIVLFCSCNAILYKKDNCGNYPKLKPVHKTERFVFSH